MKTARTGSIDLPPERRQTLAILLLVPVGLAPLVRFLSWRVWAFLGLCVGLRALALRWPELSPKRGALVGLTLVGLLNAWLVNRGVPGKAGAAAFFVAMLGLKLLELRGRRDHRVVAILLGFVVVVDLLFEESGLAALYLAGVMIAAFALLADMNGAGRETGWWRPGKLALRYTLEAVPIAFVLFLLFPRLSTPLWSVGVDRQIGSVGMSDRLEPGAISELVINGELAFRARFYGAAPPLNRLYWRGLVLWTAGPRSWSAGAAVGLKSGHRSALETASDRVDYEVILEPSERSWVFALDLPVAEERGIERTKDFELRLDRPIESPTRVRLTSAMSYRTAPASEHEKRMGLELPSNVTERMRKLVGGWRETSKTDWDLVQSALAFFNRESFRYTLLPPRLGSNPTDEFLFETKSGFCEHYASSFALLMRIAGIPSRVVLGYLGGEPNRIRDYYMVWQSDAHAWTEVLIEGRGWVRVDPTAALAPDRIDNRSAEQLIGNASSVRFDLRSDGWMARSLKQLRDLGDSIESVWQDWIIDYGEGNQNALLSRLGLDEYGESALAVLMLASVGTILAVLVGGMIREGRRLDPVEESYGLFCRKLEKVGLKRGLSEGPEDFYGRVRAARPDLAQSVREIVAVYLVLRYSSEATPEGAQKLRSLARRFRPRENTGEAFKEGN